MGVEGGGAYGELAGAPEALNEPHVVEGHAGEEELGGVGIAELGWVSLVPCENPEGGCGSVLLKWS